MKSSKCRTRVWCLLDQSVQYGCGTQIKVSGIQDALASITKTIQLAGKPSPLYCSDGIYTLVLEQMIEGNWREDPKAVPQLAVPITLPKMCYKAAMLLPSPAIQASGQLCLIAFYYLLRVGQYTQPRFVLCNGKNTGALAPNSSALAMSVSSIII